MLRAHSSVNDYMFPRAAPDRRYVTGLMMVYFFIFDHIYDTDTAPSSWSMEVRGRLSRSLVGAINGVPCQSDQFERAVMEIIPLFQQEDEAWLAGFSTSLLRYIAATLQGKDTAQKYPETSIDEYLEIRQHDSGGMWSAYLIEYAHRQYLTSEQREHPDVARARQLCIWSCSLINDLFSWL